jgi:MFS family permease
MLLLIPAIASIPLVSILPSSLQWYCLIPVFILLGIAESIVYQSVIFMIAEASPVNRLGFIQGVASAAAAGMRMIAPSISGVMWEWGVSRGSSGFVFGNAICILFFGVACALYVGAKDKAAGEYSEVCDEF